MCKFSIVQHWFFKSVHLATNTMHLMLENFWKLPKKQKLLRHRVQPLKTYLMGVENVAVFLITSDNAKSFVPVKKSTIENISNTLYHSGSFWKKMYVFICSVSHALVALRSRGEAVVYGASLPQFPSPSAPLPRHHTPVRVPHLPITPISTTYDWYASPLHWVNNPKWNFHMVVIL